ncbi:iron-uptake system permease protein feuC [Clostridium argentinense CDC 2741]|uniref:Iron-uptake system permease protein feuC n=1 Tax=Clostridium argentinense CDC 2741 TaxID=1418104 RepID=A0A0C1R3I9_9CLOT|nr:iron ABC transporter permease [Clostridium argentinense]ARC86319.1 iron ABC transporter permease [Clostridium argentinense]KIE45021.1 iron-uptake system permease protein feuC [Clostridium argentinense CDC 2741]NFF40617.1 iron ABC transporter permease [Clostridium argentinense]NFP51144.1 iron ABC transporter permease [Clostridium argentinense]NFP73258.1 iron ABC transporter permease [Clostridium argentinense]
MRRDSLRRYSTVIVVSIILILAAMYISISNGTYDISIKDLIDTIFRINPDPNNDLVIFEFRLPRVVIGALVGFGFGIAGTVIQGVTKNGLADPGILGINAGAGMAIVLFMFLFQGNINNTGWFSVFAMPLFGLLGGLTSAILIYIFAWKNGRLDTQRLILVGIAISSGLGAVSLFISLKMNPSDFEMATVWINGSIWNANWKYILSIIPWVVVLFPVILKKAFILDLFQLEENTVKSLGISTEREKAILLLSAIGIVSACVSVSGNIGFVGLLAPHISKSLVGIQHKRAIPVAGLIGMLLVIVSDFIGRTVFAPAELSVGIVISIVGIPYFVYLLLKAKV